MQLLPLDSANPAHLSPIVSIWNAACGHDLSITPGLRMTCQLVAWAEDWLREQKCTRARLGGSLHPFVAGYPVELGNERFFRRRGFEARVGGEYVWDVARDLGNYASETFREVKTFRRNVSTSPVPVIRPAQISDENALLEFFQREFPGRWRFEYERFQRHGGRLSDWMVLLTERGVDAFARLTFEDSFQPLDMSN